MLQVKLLRFFRKGLLRDRGSKTVNVDVRSSRQQTRTSKRRLRRAGSGNLYYRINVIPIEIPPLRERPKPADPVDYFMEKHALRFEHAPLKISNEALRVFMDYRWLVRERTRKYTRRLLVLKDDDVVTPYDFRKK